MCDCVGVGVRAYVVSCDSMRVVVRSVFICFLCVLHAVLIVLLCFACRVLLDFGLLFDLCIVVVC